jgi:cell division protein FtsL
LAPKTSSAKKAPASKRELAPKKSFSGKKPSASARTTSPTRPGKDASWFRWWLLPPLVGVTIAVLVALYYPVAQVQYKETRERAKLQAELTALQTRNARLAVEVARLKTNEGVEDYARSQLGMVKRGEHVVVVTDSAGSRSVQTTTGTEARVDAPELTATAPKGAWTEFLDAVFGVQ